MLCEHNSTAAFLPFLRISFCCGLSHNFQKNDVKLTDLQRCTLPHPLFLKHWHDIIFLSRFRNFLSVKRPTGNHRAGQVQRDGRGSSGPLTLLKQDHPTRNCTALCLGSSGVFTGRETSHILSQVVGFFPFFLPNIAYESSSLADFSSCWNWNVTISIYSYNTTYLFVKQGPEKNYWEFIPIFYCTVIIP